MAVTLNALNAADPALAGGIAGDAQALSQARAAGSATTTAAADNGSQPDVSFTSLSTHLAQLEGSLSAGSAISQQRVDAVSAALASGSYSIDPGRIASGVIQSEQLLRQLPGGG